MLPHAELEQLSRKLRHLHSLLVRTEREFDAGPGGLALLDRLMNDPAWSWLRALSQLIAEIDHVLAQEQPATQFDYAVVAAHARGLLFGEGDTANQAFLTRYRPLLQLEPEIAGAHGELRSLLRNAPVESANEAERLHARHQWAMRARHNRSSSGRE